MAVDFSKIYEKVSAGILKYYAESPAEKGNEMGKQLELLILGVALKCLEEYHAAVSKD